MEHPPCTVCGNGSATRRYRKGSTICTACTGAKRIDRRVERSNDISALFDELMNDPDAKALIQSLEK